MSTEDRLNAEGIRGRLREEARFCAERIRAYDCLASTNRTLREMARNGAEHGTTLLADRQSRGRGRLDHSFFSPAGGLYMSLLLRTDALRGEELPLITIRSALIVCDAVEEVTGKKPEIKWVNDLLLGGKKICGILAEGVTGMEGHLSAVVVGIGVNARTRQEEFPEEIRETAGSLDPEGEIPEIRNRLAAGIISRFFGEPFPERAEMMEQYRERLCMLGREIEVLPSGRKGYRAKAADVDENGNLIVEKKDGRRECMSSGEIHIRL